MSRFGTPLKVTTDRGAQFQSHLFRTIAEMVGAKHYRTTAYHPAANGIVERLHRQLKAAIMCHATSKWTEVLPLVLLGIRSSWKTDIQASPAELVYGEPLRLPGQFLAPTEDYRLEDYSDLATRLKSHMANLAPRPTSWHRKGPFYIPKSLADSTHVFLRQDRMRRSLETPYTGPYKVLQRHPKYYKLDVQGKEVTVSIDRLKPAYMTQEAELPPQPLQIPVPTTPVTHEKRTRSGRLVRFPDFYRPQ